MKNKIKKIKLSDIYGIIFFFIVVVPAFLYKLYLKHKKQELWLICETKTTARDNGIVFYEYMQKNHNNIKTYYAINKKSKDYLNIRYKDNTISWGSIKHYFYYMSSIYNISSHKEGNPNHLLFTILHLYLNVYNNRIFLQHGILYQNFSMFHQKNTKFKLFITGAKPEFDFVKSKYGYRENEVQYTGLSRFDNLHSKKIKTNESIILYMPTWRRWLDNKRDFVNSRYYKGIMKLLNSNKLDNFLKLNHKTLIFCPHMGLGKLSSNFYSNIDNVKILKTNNISIQDLLREAKILITDFSSIHGDFAYMKKPIIYYQYDIDDFKDKHIGKNAKDTYFNFNKHGFGKVENNVDGVIKELNKIININKGKIDKKYSNRILSFFELYDNKNNERIYNAIKGLSK